MSFLRDFPGTDSYQGDLGWIICKIKEFQSLADTISELQRAIDSLPSSIQNEVNRQLEPIIKNIDDTLNNFANRIENAENSVSDMKKQIVQIISWVSEIYGFIENYTDLIGDKVFNELKAYIDAWSKELPPVRCPVDGNMEPINTALEHLYNFYNVGISASIYDSYEITAKEYDSYKITAKMYDSYGFIFFNRKYTCMMLNPFTGVRDLISNVVTRLVDFHRNGISAEKYDLLSLTAESYDNENINAYVYDFNNPYAGNAGDYVQVGDLMNIQANKKLFSAVKE